MRISVLLPTYRPDPAFLTEAIRSVLAQTFTDWQLVIRDDPSDVETGAMVAPFLADPRITFARNPARRGIGGNWNACLADAEADDVAFLFQDDAWDPSYLARCVSILDAEPETGMVAVPHAYRTDGSAEADAFLARGGFAEIRRIRLEEVPRGTTRGAEFLRWWLARGLRPNVIGEPSFVVLRRSSVEQAGKFREDMPQGLDLEYWTRMLLAGDVHVLNEELGSFRIHGGGASMRNDAAGEGLADRLRCIEALATSRRAPSDIRDAANAAFSDQLGLLFGKALRRSREGKSLGKGNAGTVLPLLLRHPVLTARALLGVLGRSGSPAA